MTYYELTPACFPDDNMPIIVVLDDQEVLMGHKSDDDFIVKDTGVAFSFWDDVSLWTPIPPPTIHNTLHFDSIDDIEPEEEVEEEH